MRMEVRRWSKLMSLNGNARPCQPMSNRKVTLCSTDHQQHCNSCPIWLLSKQLCQPRKFGHEVIREHTQAIYFELGPLSAYIYIWLYDERKFRRESSYELPLAPKPWKHSTGRNSLVSDTWTYPSYLLWIGPALCIYIYMTLWRTQIQTRIFIWAAIGPKAVET